MWCQRETHTDRERGERERDRGGEREREIEHAHATVWMGSENNFYHVGSGDHTKVIRLSGNHPQLLSHLSSPSNLYTFNDHS